MLIAMLLGMSFNFLAVEPVVAPGLDVASKTLLRTGVALLGVRISLDQVSSLGGSTILLVLGAVLATIAFGRIAAHFMRLTPEIGYLSGGAVAICGASAALALASAMPRSPTLERSTSLAVVGVTALSSIAMILYPPLFLALGLGHHEIGIVLGATIHDVAQVVAAGYMVSPDAGATATVVKLLRVAMLAPVVIVVGVLLCPKSHGRLRGYAPPWFLVAFCVLVGINSLGFIGARFAALLVSTSQWALIIAIAAIGIKSSFRVLFTLGWKPAALMVGETVFLALLIVLALPLVRH
jgi:uncharacterized integral membrane protein (TIGR00698 family)